MNNNPIYLIVAIIVISMIFRNIAMVQRFKRQKEYITCYDEMLKGNEIAYRHICDYMQREKSPMYLNKTRFLKLYFELENNTYQETLEEMDLKSLFFKKNGNGAFDKAETAYNSDSALWMIVDMARARRFSMFDVIDTLFSKVSCYSEYLDNQLEYHLIEAIAKALNEKGDGGIKFLQDLLAGDYSYPNYDKRLIGMYKRFAAAVLVAVGESVDEYYSEDLYNFAKTLIGHFFMEDLGIYEQYKIEEETVEAETEEAEETETEETAESEAGETAEEETAGDKE